MTAATKKVVFCECVHARIIKQSVKDKIRKGLDDAGVEYQCVADLCELSAKKDPLMKELADEEHVTISACYPRAVKGLFEAADAPVKDEQLEVLNMRDEDPQDIVDAIAPDANIVIPESTAPAPLKPKAEKPAWKPWFPVIDYDRCTNCMQCLSFCLFGVYGVDDNDKIDVKNPEKCKTDCPACSRVCPDVAIMFPKYRAAPINGAPVSEDDLQREKMKVDISSLLGGDIYQTLRDRNVRAKSRFSKERDDDKALKERMKCLNELKDNLDIPDSALMSLPSMSEIQNNLEKAKSEVEKND